MENIIEAFIGATFILGLYIIYYAWSKKKKFSKAQQAFFETQWKKVINEKNLTVALLEADKLLDLALKKLGYEGSLGDKLKKAKTLFSDVDPIWKAHKLRNRIAHEINIKPSMHEIQKSLNSIHKGLRDLKAISR